MSKGIGQRDQPRTRFDNYSGEAVPPYAVLRIVDTAATEKHALKAFKPNGTTDDCTFALNLSRQVAHNASTPKHAGTCTNAYGAWALYDDNGGSDVPQPGEQWGPSTDWKLHKNQTGYRIVGGAESFTVGVTTYKRVRVQPTDAPTFSVYEFRNCSDPFRIIYLDNPAIADHNPGEVAVIQLDGVFDCWRLYGPAPFCKTGECALIIAWGANCDACSVCFYLTPCGGGSPTIVRGVEWYEYEGRVVKLDGPGHEGCYEVAVADGCFSVNEELTVEHVVDSYGNCNLCGCYELENCADEEDTVWVSTDLAGLLGVETGEDAVNLIVKRDGVCYRIISFANPCGVEAEHWHLCGFVDSPGCVKVAESCNSCCYMLTPCPDQAGDPEVAYYRLSSGDPDLTEFIDEETGESNGRVIRLAGVCYTVSVPESCPEEDVIVGLPTVEEEYDSCEDCIVTCWERCDAPGTYLKTYSDMKEVAEDGVAKRAEDGFCYKRSTLSNCDGDPTVEFTIETIINEGVDSCTICQDPRVKLTPSCGSGCSDCSGSSGGGSGSGSPTMVTDDEALFPHVGQYVKIDGECYLVEWTTDPFTDDLGCWVGPFDSCAQCGASPTRKRVVTDVYFDGSGNLMVDYADIEGVFNVCGSGSNNIASTEECEEEEA